MLTFVSLLLPAVDAPLAHAEHRHVGTVLSLDADKLELTISEAGRPRVVKLSRETQVRRGRETLTLASLHRGHRVVISLQPAPDDRARIINVAEAAPPAATPEQKRNPGLPP